MLVARNVILMDSVFLVGLGCMLLKIGAKIAIKNAFYALFKTKMYVVCVILLKKIERKFRKIVTV